jgi:16S rRNA (guanine527-N7)-methyltransferase
VRNLGGGSSSFPTPTTDAVLEALLPVLEQARSFGFLGPGRVPPQIAHARGFAEAWNRPPPASAADLGSGGGLPALVLAGLWPASRWLLVEAGQRRAHFLDGAVADLGWVGRVSVVRARAEEVGRRPDARATVELVTARSFGPPAVTAECAAPLLQLGGLLVVSEPPGGGDRWDADALRQLGLVPLGRVEVAATYAVLEQVELCPERFPRRTGIPAKRPLF